MSLNAVIERSRTDKESWRYTDVEALLKKQAVLLSSVKIGARQHRHDMDKDAGAQFLFINGMWQQDQSRLGDLPAGILSGDAKTGYRLKLAGQTCLVTQPIELLFVTDETTPQDITTRLHIELGPSGRLSLIERHETAHGVTHIVEVDILLHPQAKLVHAKIIDSDNTGAHLAMTKVQIAEGAYYDNFKLVKGGRLVRSEIETRLIGKLAQCNLYGVMLLRGEDHVDTTTRIFHDAPHGTSRQVYKSVVDGKARGVFQGKIIVKEGAQKTDGYQLSRALLLSDQAEMDAKPELEIYADDVKCSHGSTVGDLDVDALFYLRARGLSESEARGLLVRAFIDEVVDEVQVTEWRDIIHAEVQKWLEITENAG